MDTNTTPVGTGSVPAAPQGQTDMSTPSNAGKLSLEQAAVKAVESKAQPAPAAAQSPAPTQGGVPDNWEWDGNPNTVPDPLKTYAKGIQRHFTKRSMAEAELRKAGEEYQQFLQSEDWKRFNESRTASRGQTQATPSQPQVGITQAEWEEALLDATGSRASSLIQREVSRQVQEAAAQIGPIVNNVRQTQQQTQWTAALQDFADAHPEVVEYHEMGLMKPYITAELSSGKHKTYESVLNSAYESVSKIVTSVREKELTKAQGRVHEKQSAVTQPGVSQGAFDSIEVSREDAFLKAFENAAQNKKIKNKLKK